MSVSRRKYLQQNVRLEITIGDRSFSLNEYHFPDHSSSALSPNLHSCVFPFHYTSACFIGAFLSELPTNCCIRDVIVFRSTRRNASALKVTSAKLIYFGNRVKGLKIECVGFNRDNDGE